MATVKKTQETEQDLPAGRQDRQEAAREEAKSPYDRVSIRLTRDGNEHKQPLYVSINTSDFYIPRGKDVEVPRYVADYIQDMMDKEYALMEKYDEIEKRFLSDK